jgi:hypothetical protein
MVANRERNRVVLEDAIREAGGGPAHGAPAGVQAAQAARELQAAGAHVSRDSRSRWFAYRTDPVVQEWLRDLAEVARYG